MRYLAIVFLILTNPVFADKTKTDQILIVGSEQNFPPLATGNTPETAGGFSVELWGLIAKEAGINYRLSVKPFYQLLADFKSGQIDVLINLAQSEPRKAFADFSVTTVKVNGGIFMRDQPTTIKTEADLKEKSIIVLQGDLAHDYAISQGWQQQLVPVDNAQTGFKLLASGQHDAFLIAKLTGLLSLSEANITNVKPLPLAAGFAQKFAIAVHKNQPDLLASINEQLALLKTTGDYDRLYEKWLGAYEPKVAPPSLLVLSLLPVSGLLLAICCYLLYKRQIKINQVQNSQQELWQRLQKISTSVPGVIYQFRLHPDGSACFPYASEAIRHIYQVTPEEVQSDASKVFLNVHPEDYHHIVNSIQQSAANLSNWQAEYRVKFADGSVRWLFGNAIPQLESDGSVLWHGFISDITDKKQAESIYSRNQERLNFALQGANDGLWDWNLENNEVYYSPRWKSMLGYTDAELNDDLETWAQLIDPSQRENTLDKALAYIEQKAPNFEVEIRMKHKQGHWVDILSRACLAIDPEGKPLQPKRLVGTHVDITELKTVEKELQKHRDSLQELVYIRTHALEEAKNAAEQANQAKSEFLSNMSHELRTPLHAILSFAEFGLLKTADPTLQKLHDYYDRIYVSGERLLKLLNDLLDSSKFEAKAMRMDFEQCDFITLVNETIQENETLLQTKQLQIITDFCSDHLLLEIDALRIGQIIRNLLNNAIKYSPQNSSITARISLTATLKGRRAIDTEIIPAVQLEIIDAGQGIPENELESVFEKFVQSSKTKTNAGGTGLGLSICRMIAESHYGKVFARNNLNQGCSFILILPIEQPSFDQND